MRLGVAQLDSVGDLGVAEVSCPGFARISDGGSRAGRGSSGRWSAGEVGELPRSVSVRCVVRSRTTRGSLGPSMRSRRRLARSPSARRSRKSASTLWWKPGASSSVAIAYLKSMRQRTASVACRSDNPSRSCSTQTVVNWAGERPGHPSRGYQSAKSSSHHSPSSRSLTHIVAGPPGLLAHAICTLRDGTCSPERERRDNRNDPSLPPDHVVAPGNSKILDRAKLRAMRLPVRHGSLGVDRGTATAHGSARTRQFQNRHLA